MCTGMFRLTRELAVGASLSGQRFQIVMAEDASKGPRRLLLSPKRNSNERRADAAGCTFRLKALNPQESRFIRVHVRTSFLYVTYFCDRWG